MHMLGLFPRDGACGTQCTLVLPVSNPPAHVLKQHDAVPYILACCDLAVIAAACVLAHQESQTYYIVKMHCCISCQEQLMALYLCVHCQLESIMTGKMIQALFPPRSVVHLVEVKYCDDTTRATTSKSKQRCSSIYDQNTRSHSDATK